MDFWIGLIATSVTGAEQKESSPTTTDDDKAAPKPNHCFGGRLTANFIATT